MLVSYRNNVFLLTYSIEMSVSEPSLLKKKQPVEYDDNVREVFNLIAYHRDKPEVMGSANLKSQMYSADFDLFEKVYESKNLAEAKRDIYNVFKQMFSRIARLKDVYFIDFKMGRDDDLYLDKSVFKNPSRVAQFYLERRKAGLINDEQLAKLKKSKDEDELYENARKLWTLRWDKKDIDRGYKELSRGRKKTFDDAIDDKVIVKIDVVAYINGKFVEFSNLWEFYSGKRSINLATTNIVESVKEDIRLYHKNKNWIKMLKRIFVLARLRKDIGVIEKLTQIMNSNIGLLYKIRADFGTIALVLEKGYKVPVERIHDAIQQLKAQLANVYQFRVGGELEYANILKLIEKITTTKKLDEIQKGLEDLDEHLLRIVNQQTEKWIKKNKFPYREYLKKM